ncbi:DUF4123 domain-containing protein [Serratia silvae]|uniref:DUF4123 domain-containing protein n=1 Tax=Serratia silvae TaxID=2824122 RepID=A0ABT0KHK2_9GAMM|nr:DUF4123 domain-containing protein [Serratia silvae]MCL1031491.1 DUF4123 domain-containing protein [Serratia silvae]
MISYAVIDGAMEKGLLPMLEALDPPASCLYAEPVQPELVELAPYLVLVTKEVKRWLTTRDTPWGYYLMSEADLKTLRQHLRKYLQVLIPDQEKPVFFRFYDPRNIELLCDVLSDWQLHHFLGPIKTIVTVSKGTEIASDFTTRRAAFPADARSRQKMLVLQPDQLVRFNLAFEERYINKLAARMKTNAKRYTDDNYHPFAQALFYYLQQRDITDDRVISGLANLFIARGYNQLSDVPEYITTRLESLGAPGLVNAELLLIDELGSVPLLEEG